VCPYSKESKEQASQRVSGFHVLTSSKSLSVLEEKAEKKKQEAEQKAKKKQDMEEKRRQREILIKKKRKSKRQQKLKAKNNKWQWLQWLQTFKEAHSPKLPE